MEALTEVVRAGKARYLGFSEWTAGQIEAAHDAARRGALRLEPAAVFAALAPARARGDPTDAADGGDLADRLVAARPGRADRQVPRAARLHPADSRASSEQMGWAMGRFLTDEVLAAVDRAATDRGGRRPVALPARARLGAARAERRLGDRRRLAARAAGRQRGRLPVCASTTTLAAIDDALAGVVVDPG